MRKAEDIYNKMKEEMPWNLSENSPTKPYIIEAIKVAQEDAIRETVGECINNIEIDKYDEHMQFSPYINEQLILSVADKLIKEL